LSVITAVDSHEKVLLLTVSVPWWFQMPPPKKSWA